MIDSIYYFVLALFVLAILAAVITAAMRLVYSNKFSRYLTVEKLKAAYINFSLMVASCLVFFVATEVIFRLVTSDAYNSSHENRPYVPIFGQGTFYDEVPLQVIRDGKQGPGAAGYEYTYGAYIYKHGDHVIDPRWRTQWLFEEPLSYRNAAQLNDLSNRTPRPILIFVTGGSVAAGTGASDLNTSWFALLENHLREAMGRSDVYIFNCAVGSFVTGQERLVFDLAIAPYDPDMVILLNGYNDMAATSVAPSDFHWTSKNYIRTYENPWARGLRDNFAIIRYFNDQRLKKKFNEEYQFLSTDPVAKRADLESRSLVYSDNTKYLIKRGKQMNAPVLVFYQPFKPKSAVDIGASAEPTPQSQVLFDSRLRIASMLANEPNWFDISDCLSTPELYESYFPMDECHFYDPGHVAVEAAIFPHVWAQIPGILARRGDSPVESTPTTE